TVREPDGLALSSRNQYLDPDQRQHATVLYQALEDVRQQVERGERSAVVLREAMTRRIAATPSAVIDYVAVVDAQTLQPVDQFQRSVLVALAVKFGATRLIDNVVLDSA